MHATLEAVSSRRRLAARLVPALVLAVPLVGCQDPRLDFVGTWTGPRKTSVRFDDGSSATYPHGEETLVIGAPPRSNLLTFNGKCAMTATPSDARGFSMTKKVCPGERISFANSSGTGTIECDLVETVGGGSGVREGDLLTVTYFGESQISRCTNGASVVATYRSELVLSRR